MTNLEILYEDNHVIVVVKPVNVLSQADNTHDIDMLTLIKNYLKAKYQKPGNVYLGLVHRLDRPVGGVMVFAKTSKAASRLSEQVRTKEVEKNYLAIVHGILKEKEGTFQDKIEKKDNTHVYLNTPLGKDALLKYHVIKEKDNLSLVDINLLTGRYHQIRLQFSSRGYPLYGDSLYGNKEKTSICLFAYKLSFNHPITKERLTFEYLPKGKMWDKFLK